MSQERASSVVDLCDLCSVSAQVGCGAPSDRRRERIARAALELFAGGRAVALVDHTKFGRTALGTIARSDRVDTVVTDAPPAPRFREALEEAGVRLVVAERE